VVNKATVPNYGVITFDEEAIANIFSLANMVKKKGYSVTYDSSKEDAFTVHAPDPDNESVTIERKFPRNAKGLYAYKPEVMSQQCHTIDTVAENHKNHTLRQFERAKVACTLYHILGAPSIENLKHLLRTNQIKNCPVTVRDVQANFTTAAKHVGIAERNNQTIKARVRVGFHRTPC
jgi:hypothetical protein